MRPAMRMAIAAALLLGACTAPRRSIRELEGQGYSSVTITVFRRGLCAENEDFATGFRAVLDGRDVEGVVCHEPFGDDVVRFRDSK